MRPFSLLALIVALGSPARAETVVPPATFETLAEGRTLHFSLDGRPFGAEQFLPGRRTLWRFEGAQCEPGTWSAEGEALCFTYDTMGGPVCWRFLRAPDGGHAAELVEDGAASGFRLTLEAIEDAPLPCPGPEVGS